MLKTSMMAAAALVVMCWMAGPVAAQYGAGQFDNSMFLQYYANGAASQTSAGLYPAPHPVPYQNVGGAHYTYQPLYPHEMMWQHKRNYYNFYAGPEAFYADPCTCRGGGGALNKTTVIWQSGANHMGNLPFTSAPFSRVHYAAAKRWYGLGGNRGGCAGGCGAPSSGSACGCSK